MYSPEKSPDSSIMGFPIEFFVRIFYTNTFNRIFNMRYVQLKENDSSIFSLIKPKHDKRLFVDLNVF